MPLEPGTTLGHYEILSSLRDGGIGEVYRAKDTKLGREVAIKLLLEEVSQDAERLARFEREARVLASLNHPNVATLHGFETEGDTNFLVMELVEGETLADQIARGPIPADEALPIFLQIAEALEAAHEQGVIHRDLKPANVKVKPDGTVKVLDFGLAKAFQPEVGEPNLSQSPTRTAPATELGVICHDIADARIDVERVLRDPDGSLPEPLDTVQRSSRRLLAGGAVAFALGAVLAGTTAWKLRPSAPASCRSIRGSGKNFFCMGEPPDTCLQAT